MMTERKAGERRETWNGATFSMLSLGDDKLHERRKSFSGVKNESIHLSDHKPRRSSWENTPRRHGGYSPKSSPRRMGDSSSRRMSHSEKKLATPRQYTWQDYNSSNPVDTVLKWAYSQPPTTALAHIMPCDLLPRGSTPFESVMKTLLPSDEETDTIQDKIESIAPLNSKIKNISPRRRSIRWNIDNRYRPNVANSISRKS